MRWADGGGTRRGEIEIAQAFAKAFYNSAAWRHCRESYIAQRKAIDGGMCETCHEELGYIVHHKVWLTLENITDPEITLSHSKLRYDCHLCHNREGVEDEPPRYRFGPDGEVLPP